MNNLKDVIRGCLIGGAAGDALGYVVEFLQESTIFDKYGNEGIQNFELDNKSSKAVFSDDTQMTLFTASACLGWADIASEKEEFINLRYFANVAYIEWLYTQNTAYSNAMKYYREDENRFEFIPGDSLLGTLSAELLKLPQLYENRAPGMTCLSAIGERCNQRRNKVYIDSFINSKLNNSKGCGGIMRVAPIAFCMSRENNKLADIEAAECSAISHSHSLGYMSSSVLVHIINTIASVENSASLKEIIEEARDTVAEIFGGDPYIAELVDIINLAIKLSENNDSDLNNIHRLGEGWVAEETLAIAIYCSLKYEKDFSKAIITSVNHKGDSDSTGAVTGNILGARIGYEAIDAKWKNDLELKELILSVSDSLYNKFAELF